MLGSRHLIGTAAAIAAVLGLSGLALAAPGNGNGNGAGKTEVTSSIALNESVARTLTVLGFGSEVTYTTVAGDLKGAEYPMVYTECWGIDSGTLLYGQLAHPEEVFLLGGGWSQWHVVRENALCHATLLAYGGKDKGVDTIRTLASTPEFFAAA